MVDTSWFYLEMIYWRSAHHCWTIRYFLIIILSQLLLKSSTPTYKLLVLRKTSGINQERAALSWCRIWQIVWLREAYLSIFYLKNRPRPAVFVSMGHIFRPGQESQSQNIAILIYEGNLILTLRKPCSAAFVSYKLKYLELWTQKCCLKKTNCFAQHSSKGHVTRVHWYRCNTRRRGAHWKYWRLCNVLRCICPKGWQA